MRRWIGVLVLMIGACTQAGGPPAPAAPPALEVTGAGLSATPGGFSVGAAVRNPRTQDALGVEIVVEFLHVSGAVLGEAVERLAFCPADTQCLWGSTFTRDVASSGIVSAVRVRAAAAAWERGSRRVPFVAAARRPDGSVSGKAPPDGTVYVVSLVGGLPRAGVFRRTTATEEFVVPADLLPAIPGEVIRAVFYDEAMPAGE